MQFLVAHGVITDKYQCLKCDSLLKFNKHGHFQCDKKRSVKIIGEFCARFAFFMLIDP